MKRRVFLKTSPGLGVAANPMTGLVLNHAESGDKATVKWTDNIGNSGFAEKLFVKS